MIKTDAAKGRRALANGRTWKRETENVVLKMRVG
jgi:hypothetical protein